MRRQVNSNTGKSRPKSVRNRPRRSRKPKNDSRAVISPGLINGGPFPLFSRVCLPYMENLVVSGAASFLVVEWKINDPFSISPTTGGRAKGFDVYAQAYVSYHVEKFKMRFSVANNEGFGNQFGMIFRDSQPSLSITTAALARSALACKPTTGKFQVAQASGNSLFPMTKWYHADPGIVSGNQASYNAELEYTANVAASPVQVIWMAFIVLSPGGNLTNGVFLDLELEFQTRFYSLYNVIN